MAFSAKGVLYYRYRDAGWSETYWLTGNDFPTAKDQLDTINTARMGLSLLEVICIGGVVYDIGDPRTRESFPFAATTDQGTYPSLGVTDVHPDFAVDFKLQGASFRFANRWLRAAPSSVIGTNLSYTTVAAWETAFGLYGATITANCNLRHVSPGPPPVVTTEAVVGVENLKRCSSRKTGRPFGLSRGRRLAG